MFSDLRKICQRFMLIMQTNPITLGIILLTIILVESTNDPRALSRPGSLLRALALLGRSAPPCQARQSGPTAKVSRPPPAAHPCLSFQSLAQAVCVRA